MIQARFRGIIKIEVGLDFRVMNGEMMHLFSKAELESAAQLVGQVFPPTSQQVWPQLSQRFGCPVWVKHENHTPVGAFKIRGGITYFDRLLKEQPDIAGVVAATRGNHGQSIAFAAGRAGLPAIIIVPEGNSKSKNEAMQALGAELIIRGRDFQESLEFALSYGQEKGYHFVPSFHPWLVLGVATYSMELLKACPNLKTIYIPIGLGSGICGLLQARSALNHPAAIVGVVAEGAPVYALSWASGTLMETAQAHTIADGIACRIPNADAWNFIKHHLNPARGDGIIQVSEQEIEQAIAIYFQDTHNVAEGAGAAALAGLIHTRNQGSLSQANDEPVGVILTGGNIDMSPYAKILSRFCA